MYAIINLLLGLVLLVSVVVIIIRKVFLGINGTDSLALNLTLIVFSLIGLICTLYLIFGVFEIQSLTAFINSEKSLSPKEMAMAKQRMLESKTRNNISILIGFASLVFDFIVFSFIDKKNKQEQLKEINHWDWNKLS